MGRGGIYLTGTTCDVDYPVTAGALQTSGGSNSSSQCNNQCQCQKCFFHEIFLLNLVRRDGACAQKFSHQEARYINRCLKVGDGKMYEVWKR